MKKNTKTQKSKKQKPRKSDFFPLLFSQDHEN